MRAWVLSIRVAILAALAAMSASRAMAAELKVMSSSGNKAALEALAPIFEKSSGAKLVFQFDTTAVESRKLEAGETFDVAFANPPLFEALVGKGYALADSVMPIGAVYASIGYRHGEPKPDIATREALKTLLLKVKSISFSDPAAGGTSSVYFNGILRELGLLDEVMKKAVLTKGGQGAFPVGEGRAEIGVAQSSEVALVPGLDAEPIFPSDPKSKTSYSVGISSHSEQRELARAFEKFLMTPEAAAIRKSKGMLPE